LRWGMEKLTPGYDRHALVELLGRLPPDAAVSPGAPLLSSSLRFLATGSAAGCEAWFKMNVEMSRKRDVCVGWSSAVLSASPMSTCVLGMVEHTNSGVHALAQLMIASKSLVYLRGMGPCRSHDGGVDDSSRYWRRLRDADLVVQRCEGHGACAMQFSVAGLKTRRVESRLPINLAPRGTSDITCQASLSSCTPPNKQTNMAFAFIPTRACFPCLQKQWRSLAPLHGTYSVTLID
jgi:hypothetical protein